MRGYEQLWDPAHWEPENDIWDWEDEFTAQFVTQSDTDFFEVSFNGTSTSVLARALGMYLVGHMPKEGLLETVTALRDFFEFYTIEPARYLPRPTIEKLNARVTAETPEKEQ